MDGKQVAPLMGDYTDPDVGTLRIRSLPNFWIHASCDHSVAVRLTPNGLTHTSIRMIWLVDGKAEEGRDYDLDKLLPFWLMTAEQDWEDLRQPAARGELTRLHSRSALHIQGIQPRSLPALVHPGNEGTHCEND